jgi:hypothetical protein
MLPVVATIWDKIVALQEQGHNLTSAALLELYLQAMYRRKEEEIENDRRFHAAPEGASYLLLPREVREVFTLAAVWKMVDSDTRNTITRASFDGVIAQLFDEVFRLFQSDRIPQDIIQRVRAFEERFKDETKGDRLERISNEIASSGLFVPDPAGGPSNLRLPHKQFYEYMIGKVAWMVLAHRDKMTSKLFQSVARHKSPFEKLLAESLALQFFAEIIGPDFTVFRSIRLHLYISTITLGARLAILSGRFWRLVRKSKYIEEYSLLSRYGEEYRVPQDIVKYDFIVRQSVSILMMYTVSAFGLVALVSLALRPDVGFGISESTSQNLRSVEVGLFVVFAILFTLGVFLFTFSPFVRFPRFLAFRGIVYSHLKSRWHGQTGELTVLTFYEECLFLLSGSRKSLIVQEHNEERAAGQLQDIAQREFQESIAPLA